MSDKLCGPLRGKQKITPENKSQKGFIDKTLQFQYTNNYAIYKTPELIFT